MNLNKNLIHSFRARPTGLSNNIVATVLEKDIMRQNPIKVNPSAFFPAGNNT